MTNNVQSFSQIPVAASTPTPPPPQGEKAPEAARDQVSIGQQPAEPVRKKKLVVSLDVDERLLTPDASGKAPINDLEPVFIAKAEVPKQDPSHVPSVLSGQFAPDGGDLLVVPVPPHTNTSKFIAVPMEVQDDMLVPSGQTNPDGSAHRPIDDFDARLTPHDAVIKKPSDYQADLQEAYDGGKNDYLPQGYTRVVANSKAGQIIEMTGGIVSKVGMVGSGFGNMTLAGWNSMMGLSAAGTLAGIGGAIGVLGALDQMKKLTNEKGRLEYLKQNYDAGETRQSLLSAAPEAGAKYIEALKTKFEAEHVLLEPSTELKQYDDAIAKGEKKAAKGKLNEGQTESLAKLKQERDSVKARVDALKAKAEAAANQVATVRAQLPEGHAAKFDAALNALAPQLQHYEANRGDQMSLSQAQVKALSAEGVGAVPMQTPGGIRNVSLEEQIKGVDTQVKVQGVSAIASGLGMTCGILATLGVGCPPLLAAAAVLLPMAGLVLVVGKPIAMLSKMLWNKMFNKDQSPTPEKAVTGAKAKPEGPKETAAWEKSMAIRSDLISADKVNGQGYLDSLQKLETARQAVMRAPSAEEAGKLKAEHQQVAIELGQFEQALEKSAPGKVGEFKSSLADLNDCWAERKTGAALEEQFYTDVLSAGVVTRSAEKLGLTEAQTKTVMANLLQAEFGHRESAATVTGWQSQNPAQLTPEARLAAVLIQTSQALQKGDDPSKAVKLAEPTPPGAPPAPTQAPAENQTAAPAPAPSQAPDQRRAQLEQQTYQMVMAAIQGDPKADAELTRIGQAAAADPAAKEQFEISQLIIGSVAQDAQQTIATASPEVMAQARNVSDAIFKGEPTAQTTLQELVGKAQAGDQAAAQQLKVIDALYVAHRLNIPTEQAAPAAG